MTRIKRKKVLVCFTGMDGTGKTTVSKKLSETMNEQGIKTRYVWSGLEPRLLLPFFRVGRAVFVHQKGQLAGNYIRFSTPLRDVLRNPFIRIIYEFVLILDYTRQLLWNIRIPMMRGESIVSDRYGYDILIDMCVVLGYSDGKMAMLLKAFKHLLPEPSLAFLIDAPEETAFVRKDDIPSIMHLSERRELYIRIAKQHAMTMIDGSDTLPALQTKIWNKVQEIL